MDKIPESLWPVIVRPGMYAGEKPETESMRKYLERAIAAYQGTARPAPDKPITTMSDQEKLSFICASYNNLMALERGRRALIAKMIRACTQRIRREAPRTSGSHAEQMADRKKWRDDIAAAWKGLDELATMLEAESVRSPDTKSTEG